MRIYKGTITGLRVSELRYGPLGLVFRLRMHASELGIELGTQAERARLLRHARATAQNREPLNSASSGRGPQNPKKRKVGSQRSTEDCAAVASMGFPEETARSSDLGD